MNKITKVLILAVYSIVIIMLSLFLTDKATAAVDKKIENQLYKVERFTDYTNTPENDDIAINVQVKEVRTSKEENDSDYQYSKYDVYVSVVKKDSSTFSSLYTGKASISNMFTYCCAEVDGKYHYSETSTAKTISSGSQINNTTSFLNSSTEFAYHEVTVSDDVVTNSDYTPEKFYIKVLYDIKRDGDSEAQTKELNYCFDYTKPDTSKFSTYENREVSSYISYNEDPIAIKLIHQTSEATETSVAKDTFKFNILEAVASNLESDQTISKVNVSVCGLINDSNEISEYFDNCIQLFSYNGAVVINNGIKLSREVNLNQAYKIDKLYITAHVELSDGVNKDINYYVNVKDLPTA